MNKRQRDLAAKLGNEAAPAPGWKEQINPTPAPEPEPSKLEYIRKTYLVTPELIERVKQTADREKVGQNELLRYLLTWALDELDEGNHHLPLEEEKSHRIKF